MVERRGGRNCANPSDPASVMLFSVAEAFPRENIVLLLLASLEEGDGGLEVEP